MVKDPRYVERGRKNKRRGSNFESRVRAFLRKYGWYVQRNTFGLYDIIALPPLSQPTDTPPFLSDHAAKKEPLKLQPTTQKYPPKEKIKTLKDNDSKWIGVAYLVQIDYDHPRHQLKFTKVVDL